MKAQPVFNLDRRDALLYAANQFYFLRDKNG